MDLVWATSDLLIGGVAVEGLPILLDREMRGVDPANRFLRHALVHRGRCQSRKSWATVGQHMLAFFSFLEANDLSWKSVRGREGESPLAAFRNYSSQSGQLSPRTINQRLGTAVSFYRFALSQKWIEELPYGIDARLSPGSDGRRGRLRGASRLISPDVMLRVQKPPVEYLTRDEIKVLLRSIRNETHRLMVRLGLQVGLRREEIATFPLSYVEEALKRAQASRMVRVLLSPKDGTGMKTKGGRERHVYIPSALIADLWDYAIHERPRLERNKKYSALFLTMSGSPWAADGKGFLRVLADLGRKAGIRVHPHLLRHTYATHTLAALQTLRERIDPLVFLQRQLGHSSIETTMVYAHLANELAIESTTSYDDEVSEWSRRHAETTKDTGSRSSFVGS